MKSEDQNQKAEIGGHEPPNNVDNSRRSFSKRGLVAVPLLTLANRSAWANYCVASGFQSFAIAARLGQNLSHGTFTPPSGSGWKNAAGWLLQVTSVPGTAWPSNYLPTRIKPTGGGTIRYEIRNLSTGFWSGNYLANDPAVAKGFVSSLVTGSSDSRTIYSVLLANSSADKILLYKIATEFNKLISTPAIPFPNLTGEVFNINGVAMTDYEIFYSSCI